MGQYTRKHECTHARADAPTCRHNKCMQGALETTTFAARQTERRVVRGAGAVGPNKFGNASRRVPRHMLWHARYNESYCRGCTTTMSARPISIGNAVIPELAIKAWITSKTRNLHMTAHIEIVECNRAFRFPTHQRKPTISDAGHCMWTAHDHSQCPNTRNV